jgi:hypothetical protein
MLVSVVLKGRMFCPCGSSFLRLIDLRIHVRALHGGSSTRPAAMMSPSLASLLANPALPEAGHGQHDMQTEFTALMPEDLLVSQAHGPSLLPFEVAVLDWLSLSLSNLKVLICTHCKEGVHSKQACEHALEKHNFTIRDGSKHHFDHVINSLISRGLLTPFRWGPRPQPIPMQGNLCQELSYLKDPIPGFRCLEDDCTHAHISSDGRHSHPSSSLVPFHVQTVFSGPSAAYFPVIDESEPCESPSPSERGLAVVDQILRRPPPRQRAHLAANFRNLNKLILISNWHHNFAVVTKDPLLLVLVQKLTSLPDHDFQSKDADMYTPIRIIVKEQLGHLASMVINSKDHGLPFAALGVIGRDQGCVPFIMFHAVQSLINMTIPQ